MSTTTLATARRTGTARRWHIRLGGAVLGAVIGAGLLAVVSGQPAAAEEFTSEVPKYRLTNLDSGHVLDNANNSWISGTPVIQWPYHAGQNQRWHLRKFGDHNWYQIINSESGLCLTAQTYVVTIYTRNPDGTNSTTYRTRAEGGVTQTDCDGPVGNTLDYWRLVDLGGGVYRIEVRVDSPGFYLGVVNRETGSQVEIVEAPDNAAAWRIEEAPYWYESHTVSVPALQIRELTEYCADGYRVETRPGSNKPRYDYLGDSELDIHDVWIPSGQGGRIKARFGNPTLSAKSAQIRVYCVG